MDEAWPACGHKASAGSECLICRRNLINSRDTLERRSARSLLHQSMKEQAKSTLKAIPDSNLSHTAHHFVAPDRPSATLSMAAAICTLLLTLDQEVKGGRAERTHARSTLASLRDTQHGLLSSTATTIGQFLTAARVAARAQESCVELVQATPVAVCKAISAAPAATRRERSGRQLKLPS